VDDSKDKLLQAGDVLGSGYGASVRCLIAAAVAAAGVAALLPAPAASKLHKSPTTLGDCTLVARPGDGLQRLVARLRPGQTACLAPGDYNIRRLILNVSGAPKAPIVLRSLMTNQPATLHGVVWLSKAADYWIVQGLRIDGRNPWNLPSPIVNGSHSLWRRNDVSNHGSGDGTQPYGGGICFNLGQTDSYGYATDTIIEQSSIHDCGISNNHNHGIYAVATSGTTIIRDNWIYQNGDRGIQLYPAGEHITITHNVIDGNGSGIIFSGLGSLTSRDVTVSRNIISNSRNRWNVESWYPDGTPIGTDNLVVRNCLWADSPNDYYNSRGGIGPAVGFAVGGGNLVQQPRFLGSDHGNLALRRSSGCKGFGPSVEPPVWRR
jgi:hypothetical protein